MKTLLWLCQTPPIYRLIIAMRLGGTVLHWLRRAAEQGDAGAQNNLGLVYYDGKGVPQDYKVAALWYRRAADQGQVEAQYNLGVMYYEGKGVPQNYKTAAQWYIRAADQGSVRAQNNLGVMYALGEGVPQDYVHAHMWANIAASSGENNAAELRNFTEKQMTPSQIADAQKLAQEWARKDC